jgi:hypothetical protein
VVGEGQLFLGHVVAAGQAGWWRKVSADARIASVSASTLLPT